MYIFISPHSVILNWAIIKFEKEFEQIEKSFDYNKDFSYIHF